MLPNGMFEFHAVAFTCDRATVGSVIAVSSTQITFATAKQIRPAPIQDAVGIQVGTFVTIGLLNGIPHPLYVCWRIYQFLNQ